jgi:predicted molibdopterin-dependent oxidoreductase YjgC
MTFLQKNLARRKAKPVIPPKHTGDNFQNFHFTNAPVNILANPFLDPTGKIPEYKVCAVKLASV